MCCPGEETGNSLDDGLRIDPQDGGLKTNFKVVLIGHHGVGKTCLVRRYIFDQYEHNHHATIGASFLTKTIDLPTDDKIKLEVWDTAGEERYHALAPMYYRGSDVVMLVFDLTDRDTFVHLDAYAKQITQFFTERNRISPLYFVVGTKNDLPERRVSEKEVDEWSKSYFMSSHYHETSAKENIGVKELFENIVINLPIERMGINIKSAR